MGLGLLLSALSGAGQGVEGSLESQQKAQQAQDLMEQQQELQAQKAIQVSQATQQNAADLADTQRTQAASRIAAAASPYLQQSVLANAMADHDWVSAQKETGMPVSISSLTADDMAKYAPTKEQQLAATVAGAKDTGDLSPQGLLQASLADQANKRMMDMEKTKLDAQKSLSEEQMANQLKVAGIYAARSGAGASDPGIAIAMQSGAKLDAQAREADIMVNKLRTELSSGNIPQTVNGQPNPDYVAAMASLQEAAAASKDLHSRSIQLYAHAGSKTGLPPEVLRAITGGTVPGAAAPSGAGGAWVYNPTTGKVEPPAGAPSNTPAPDNTDFGTTGSNW